MVTQDIWSSLESYDTCFRQLVLEFGSQGDGLDTPQQHIHLPKQSLLVQHPRE